MTPKPSGGGSAGQPAPIRIVIADDHAVVRDGLRALIQAQPGIEVVGEAESGEAALQQTLQHQPDVVLLDLSMPRGGPTVAARIARECPGARVVVLTMHEERGYVTRLLQAGAAGYVLKRTASADLVRAIRTVAGGGSYVDPSLAGTLLSQPGHSPRARAQDAGRIADLTPREAEVLRLVARGHTNKEIAESLTISVKTVETHKASGMAKLGLSSRAALVRFAIGERWLSKNE